MKVFLPLYLAASKQGEAQVVTIATIKRWLSVLIKRSLMLELVRGSIQLHDIVSTFSFQHVCMRAVLDHVGGAYLCLISGSRLHDQPTQGQEEAAALAAAVFEAATPVARVMGGN